MTDLLYLNAANAVLDKNPGALHKIHDLYHGDWKRAWDSRFSRYLVKKSAVVDAAIFRARQKLVDPEKEWKKLKADKIEIITINDKKYPKLLKHIPDPPFILYIRGSLDYCAKLCIAVVGTRTLSDYGKRTAPHIVGLLASAGCTIISGLADGIDTLAHKTALEAGGGTIAVLGTGIDDRSIFPQRNLKLAKSIIASGGALISEYAPGTNGTKYTFPQRNRIISGLSKGTLVIEAGIKSGSIITANCALDQNRDVFAVPGNIFSRTSEGTNAIIKKGAALVTHAQDILDVYDIKTKTANTIRAENETESLLLSVLGAEPLPLDEIVRATGLNPSEAGAALVVMELSNKVRNLGNGKYTLRN
ncbi:MAG: DNA processing protein [Parcubacteria group bacterium Licking1014_17]|nr:MAG: DNA processing protein [Parcubacteria group bacterium Licking1014_17]